MHVGTVPRPVSSAIGIHSSRDISRTEARTTFRLTRTTRDFPTAPIRPGEGHRRAMHQTSAVGSLHLLSARETSRGGGVGRVDGGSRQVEHIVQMSTVLGLRQSSVRGDCKQKYAHSPFITAKSKGGESYLGYHVTKEEDSFPLTSPTHFSPTPPMAISPNDRNINVLSARREAVSFESSEVCGEHL